VLAAGVAGGWFLPFPPARKLCRHQFLALPFSRCCLRQRAKSGSETPNSLLRADSFSLPFKLSTRTSRNSRQAAVRTVGLASDSARRSKFLAVYSAEILRGAQWNMARIIRSSVAPEPRLSSRSTAVCFRGARGSGRNAGWTPECTNAWQYGYISATVRSSPRSRRKSSRNR
jgi:hypothetical protein